MEQFFVAGQRWISEPEPDLGLGTVVQVSKGRVQLHFEASDETRMYAAAAAPLKRVHFRIGDTITSQDDQQLVVEDVEEQDGLFIYHGAGLAIPEARLSNAISFHTARDRLLSGQIDENKAFTLRRQTLEFKHQLRESPVRGFIGGRIDLIPHQLYIAHEVSSRYAPRVLLSDEVGLGKTIEACLIVHRMLLSGRASRVLIVVPESLVHQWFVEMLRRFNLWLNIYDEERCEAVEGSAPENNPFLDDQLILCSQEFLAGSEKRALQAVAAGWDILVVDEAHHLEWSVGNPSKPYLVVEALSKGSAGVLLLTATPEQLGLESHFARLRLLDPVRYDDFEAFKSESTDFQQLAGLIDKIEDKKALTEEDIAFVSRHFQTMPAALAQRLASSIKLEEEDRQQLINELLDLHGPGRVLFRNTRAGMSGFPQRIAHLIPLTPAKTKSVSDLQAAMTEEFAYDTAHQSKEPRYAFQQDPRLNWLVQFLKEHNDTKVLLICRTRARALALHDAFRSKVNISAGIFHEGLTLVQRDRNAAWFADPQGAQLLICSEIGSEGRNFQFAHHLVLFDLPPNPELLEQRIGRLDRIGQKEDIHIHIPFLKNSPQEVLARWYQDGLNAIEKNLVGTNTDLQALRNEVIDTALQSAKQSGKQSDKQNLAEPLIKKTATIQQALEERLHAGRDRLLEMNSFRPAVAQRLVASIRAEDQSLTLENYMIGIFEQVGIQPEELAPRTYYLNPQRMTIDSFPALPEDGLSVTFDRARALVREEITFLTWDHPMVTGAMDLIMGSESGNSSYGVLPAEESDVLLEAIFVMETVADQKLQANRYLPNIPIRVLVNKAGEDFSAVHTPDAFSKLLGKGDPSRLLDNSLVTQQLIPDMLQTAEEIAETRGAEILSTHLADMNRTLDFEINRLKSLQQIHGHIRPNEIALATGQQEILQEALQNARLRLDAVRLVWATSV